MFAGRDADMPPNSNIPRAPYTNLICSRPVAEVHRSLSFFFPVHLPLILERA